MSPLIALGGVLVWFMTTSTAGSYFPAALAFGVLPANAGLVLIELVTKRPMKMAVNVPINVPFVAANF